MPSENLLNESVLSPQVLHFASYPAAENGGPEEDTAACLLVGNGWREEGRAVKDPGCCVPDIWPERGGLLLGTECSPTLGSSSDSELS